MKTSSWYWSLSGRNMSEIWIYGQAAGSGGVSAAGVTCFMDSIFSQEIFRKESAWKSCKDNLYPAYHSMMILIARYTLKIMCDQRYYLIPFHHPAILLQNNSSIRNMACLCTWWQYCWSVFCTNGFEFVFFECRGRYGCHYQHDKCLQAVKIR